MRVVVLLICLLPSLVWSKSFSAEQKQFVQKLLPAIQASNSKIEAQRKSFEQLWAAYRIHKRLSDKMMVSLRRLAQQYDLDSVQLNQPAFWQELNLRINTLPASLVIAQAINESAWGRSRFAKRGLNFFGQWCFSPGCGIVPAKRPKGAQYEVKRFASVSQSVDSYFYNVNTNPAYQDLRQSRAKLKKPSGLRLAQGLSKYSTRGQDYVRSIQGLIKRYNLLRYDS